MTQQIPDEIVSCLASLLFGVKRYVTVKEVSDGMTRDLSELTVFIAYLTDADPEELADKITNEISEAIRHAVVTLAASAEGTMQ